ncbi:hypothetical protein PIROE2DRAFT_18005 [Piromyces sp. E2]|nr:hypothetical protein PIROE2DRAFT_18005 [Piromyces sp. E2]|eukprot:OUM57112.1 hypothetical protein PIROE2DRAFT_18005 [Piromyces sp. E2]
MKFNNLFTLLLASSAFAYHIQRRDELENASQTNPAASNPATNPANNSQAANPLDLDKLNTEKCKDLYDAITKCINPNSNAGNIEDFCSNYNTPECQQVANKDFSGCELYKSVPGMELGLTRLVCAQDENGKLCPTSEAQQKKLAKNINENMINDTCKSKICSEQIILGLKEVKNSSNDPVVMNIYSEESKEEMKNFDRYIAILSEEKCIGSKTVENKTMENKNSESKSNESSGATHIKIGSALLISFVALLFSHF